MAWPSLRWQIRIFCSLDDDCRNHLFGFVHGCSF